MNTWNLDEFRGTREMDFAGGGGKWGAKNYDTVIPVSHCGSTSSYLFSSHLYIYIVRFKCTPLELNLYGQSHLTNCHI